MYSHNYRTLKVPSEPVIEVFLENPDNSQKSVVFTAFVDSGADGTLIPLNYLESIEAERVGRMGLPGITGVKITVDTYLVTVTIGNYQIHGIEASGISNSQEPIIGRDVLNQLIVTLNGLAGVVEISD